MLLHANVEDGTQVDFYSRYIASYLQKAYFNVKVFNTKALNY